MKKLNQDLSNIVKYGRTGCTNTNVKIKYRPNSVQSWNSENCVSTVGKFWPTENSNSVKIWLFRGEQKSEAANVFALPSGLSNSKPLGLDDVL